MPIEVTMPRLSDTMEQGTVVKWHVAEGDAVESGQVVADIETDKATMELESFDAGTVAKILAAEGTQVAVGSLIMVVAEEGEDPAAAAAAAGSGATAAAAEGSNDTAEDVPAATATAAPPAPVANGQRVFASPLARKLAADSNVDLTTVTGTGPSGRIVKKDVEAAIGSGAPAAPAPTTNGSPAPIPTPAPPLPDSGSKLEHRSIPVTSMRATIARRLVESKADIPHYYVTVEIRMDELLALRKQLNQQLHPQGVKLSVNDFIIRACALAMHEHPYVNSRWVHKNNQDAIELTKDVNIGMAIALEREGGGLVVGTIRNADQIGLRQVSAEAKRLAAKAREKGLSIEEMADQTFTISNLGMFGVRHYTAIINPPNTAILAVGAAAPKALVEADGSIVAGTTMDMTLSSDHRVIDGAMAAKYLQTVRNYLENPATLLV